MNDLIVIDRLVKYFDIGRHQRVHAVDDISLTIGEAECLDQGHKLRAGQLVL